jgi:hypothetical protein
MSGRAVATRSGAAVVIGERPKGGTADLDDRRHCQGRGLSPLLVEAARIEPAS